MSNIFPNIQNKWRQRASKISTNHIINRLPLIIASNCKKGKSLCSWASLLLLKLGHCCVLDVELQVWQKYSYKYNTVEENKNNVTAICFGFVIFLVHSRLASLSQNSKWERNQSWKYYNCCHERPGARFSKVPKAFRVRKAIRKTWVCLFCKAGLFICCKGNKNNCKVLCLDKSSFWRYINNYVTRNVPNKFHDFRETGPWPKSAIHIFYLCSDRRNLRRAELSS